MAKEQLPKDATVLWKWMDRRDVTVAELAALLHVTPNYLGDVRRGKHRPSDALKFDIERVTVEIEKKAGVKKPRGVRATDWFARAA